MNWKKFGIRSLLGGAGFALMLSVVGWYWRDSRPTQKPQAEFIDLKGDYLGETLSEFRKRYPKIECKDKSNTIVYCWQDEASLVGILAATDDAPLGGAGGIEAEFFKGRLTFIAYRRLQGTDSYKIILNAMKKKFGPPTTESDRVAVWKNLSWTLTLKISTISHSELFQETDVLFQLKDYGYDKDI